MFESDLFGANPPSRGFSYGLNNPILKPIYMWAGRYALNTGKSVASAAARGLVKGVENRVARVVSGKSSNNGRQYTPGITSRYQPSIRYYNRQVSRQNINPRFNRRSRFQYRKKKFYPKRRYYRKY